MKIVCLGDSLTEGDYGISGKSGIANVKEKGYPYFLRKLTGAQVENFGKCGYTATSYLGYYNAGNVNVKGSDVVIIMLGTNGGLDFRENVQGNDDYRQLISLIKRDEPGARIVLCTPPHVTVNPKYSNCGAIGNVEKATPFVKELSREAGVQLIDSNGYTEFNCETEEIYQANDGLHFVEAGYKKLAELIFQDIRRLYPDLFK